MVAGYNHFLSVALEGRTDDVQFIKELFEDEKCHELDRAMDEDQVVDNSAPCALLKQMSERQTAALSNFKCEPQQQQLRELRATLQTNNKEWVSQLTAVMALVRAERKGRRDAEERESVKAQQMRELEQQLRQFEEQALEHDVERQTSEAMKQNFRRTIQVKDQERRELEQSHKEQLEKKDQVIEDKDEELRRLRDEIAQLKLPQQIVPYHPAQGQQIEELKLSDSAPVFTPSRATTGSFQPSLSGIAEEPPNEQRHSALNANAKVYDHHPTIQNNAAISAMAHQIHMAALTTPAAQPYYAPLAHPMQYTMQYTYYASKE